MLQSAPGTEISSQLKEESVSGSSGVKGFATIEHVALVNVEGTGMIGVPGTAATIFQTIKEANINAIMISQASSEHSVSFAVKGSDASAAVTALRRRFKDAIQSGRISCVDAIEDCCILAAVGSGMASRPGVSATLFSALAKANINLRAIAQGCSEYNVTCLIDQSDAVRGLRAVHSRFYSKKALPIGVGLVGPGLIGSTFLSQLKEQREKLEQEYHVDFKILGIASSKKMLNSENGIDLESWKTEFDQNAAPIDLNAFADNLARNSIPNTVILDCTASGTFVITLARLGP